MDSDANTKKLGVFALAALVVSAMVGGGIFSLPQNMAQYAGSLGVIIAWVITGVGIFFIANTFRILAAVRPDATTGIYAYSRIGFGRFAGFQIAWSYWLCNIFGNVGYAVMLMDAFDYFFPGVFTGGNNIWSIVGGSVVIWLMNFIVLAGIKQAAFINFVGTIAKLLPILLFIIIMIFVFSWATFSTDMTAQETIKPEHVQPLGSLWSQVTGCMLVTLWAFIGIEGAVVVSGRAKSQNDVGKATVLGFLGCLLIYALLSLVPFGSMTQNTLSNLSNPSTAPILQTVVGTWGGWVMNLGVIIALLTSWLAFTIMIAQIPYAAAMDGTFPNIFRRENAHSTPSVSLWVTSLIMQLTMVMVLFANNAWNTMLSITSIMIVPAYMGCSAFLWKLCQTKNYPTNAPVKRPLAWIYGVLGFCFGLWMLYSGGLSYVLMAFLFFAAGIPLFIYTRKKNLAKGQQAKDDDGKLFTKLEFIAMIILLVGAVGALVHMGYGYYKTYEAETPAHRTTASAMNHKTEQRQAKEKVKKDILEKSHQEQFELGRVDELKVTIANEEAVIKSDEDKVKAQEVKLEADLNSLKEDKK